LTPQQIVQKIIAGAHVDNEANLPAMASRATRWGRSAASTTAIWSGPPAT